MRRQTITLSIVCPFFNEQDVANLTFELHFNGMNGFF